MKNTCFRPLNGVLFYLLTLTYLTTFHCMFSSPQRGSFLSTKNWSAYEAAKDVFVPSTGFFSIYKILFHNILCDVSFRPLNGVLFYLLFLDLHMEEMPRFSSPQRGSFLSTNVSETLINFLNVFVPSTGFFSIYPASRSPLNLVVSRRVCGGNRIHLRNLSKKYIFSSKSFILWAAGQNIVLNWSVCHISHTHIIQFSLVFCTLTYVRCYFQANILCMFMRSI